MSSCTLLLLLTSCSGALASHFYGGTVTFTPKGRNPDGSFRVDFRYKQTYDSCVLSNDWACITGNCGSSDRFEVGEVDRNTNGANSNRGRWCQSEALVTRNIPINNPFAMWKTGCCWISSSARGPWKLLTHVDLGIRSDTQEPNRSPVTTILPFIRVPQNCPRRFQLLAHDPDNDQVRCRYGINYLNECYHCSHYGGAFLLDQNSCTLTYRYGSTRRPYAFELVLEDFPRQRITLSYTDGTMSNNPPVGRDKRSYYGYGYTTEAPTPIWPPRTTEAPTPIWPPRTTEAPTRIWPPRTAEAPTPIWPPRTTEAPTHIWPPRTAEAPTPIWPPRTAEAPTPIWPPRTAEAPTPIWPPRTAEAPTPIWPPRTAEAPTPTWPARTTSPPTPTEAPTPTWPPRTTETPSPIWPPRTAEAPTPIWPPRTAEAPTPTWPARTTSPPTPTEAPTPTWPPRTTETPTPIWPPRTAEAPTPTWPPRTTEAPTPTWPPRTTEAPTPTWPPRTTEAPTPTWPARTTSPPTPTEAPTPTWPPRTAEAPTPIWAPRTTEAPTTMTMHMPMPMPMTIQLSKIPLQFAIQVDPAVQSCTEGQIIPQFLSPTPIYGAFRNASVNRELEIKLKATASQSRVFNFIISGPLNITKYNTFKGAVGESVLRWTPTENDFGDHVPICFIAESRSGSRIFHSEMRCIIVFVVHPRGKANVICDENTMTVEVEKASIIGIHEDHLRLNDASCTPISNSTHVIAAMSLSSCGTILEEDADNLIFRNEIMAYDNLGDVITRKHQVEIGFSCSYPKNGNVSLEFRAHKLPYVFTEKGFGKFTYQFEFFHSNQFNRMVDPNTYPIEVPLREMIYMDIQATSSIANTELFVESCRATPVDDPNYHIFYNIFENGCTMDETVVVYPSNPSEFKFGMEAFLFIGQHEEVFISCSVIMCVAGEPHTRCSQGCINATAAPVVHHHHRRGVATETVKHHISQGPLRLKKSTDITASNVSLSLNINLVFIAAVLLVTVPIVCGAVIYTAKRSTFKYQPLPSTDF